MAYCTAEQSSGMLSLIDKPLGYDRWWISLNSFGTFLGTMPTGGCTKTGKGVVSKGPAILPASSSLDSFENRMSGFCRALFKLGASNEVISPMKLIRKPKRKPLIKYYFKVWS